MTWALLREAAATARSQPVASALTLVVVAGMIVAVMLTAGRTVAAEQQVLGSIDSAGTRSITVRAEDSAGVTSAVLQRIAHVEGIEWAGAFSAAVDATNALIPDGTRVPVRLAYGSQFGALGIPDARALPDASAYVSDRAREQFGLVDGVGAVTQTTGAGFSVVGDLDVPDFLAGMQPLALVPRTTTGAEPISILVVIAESPELVAPVSDAVLSLVAGDDPTKITVQTSEELARLRGLIEGQLGSLSRGLVLGLLVLTGLLVAALLYGLVTLRRKDYGRRRALGASRGLVIALLVTQTALLALAGVALGSAVSIGVLIATSSPLPDGAFFGAIGVLAVVTALLAATLPALAASRREPMRELRVP